MKIYLDHNATTPLRPKVIELIKDLLPEVGNSASVHHFGRRALHHVEYARRAISEILDVDASQVVFNSGATEGNNTIIKHFAHKYAKPSDKCTQILVSAIEHPSIIDCGVSLEKIAVNEQGVIDLQSLEIKINDMVTHGEKPALISTMLVNNETGVVQPVEDIAKIAKRHGIPVHCDAVQGFGRINFTRAQLGVDYLTLSAHKIGGMQGVGAMVFAPHVEVPVWLRGGGQERRQRAGTSNVLGIASFGCAAQLAVQDVDTIRRLKMWRDEIEATLLQNPAITVAGFDAQRVGNTSMFVVEGWDSDVLMMRYDLEGVAVSTGSACSSGSSRTSHVLSAMGLSSKSSRAFMRVSLGHSTQEYEVKEFIKLSHKLIPHSV